MNILRLCVLPVIVLLLAQPLTAQMINNDAGMVWKRQIARLVDTRDTLDAKGHVHKKEYGDTILAKLLIDAAKTGKLTLYATKEDLLSSRPIDEHKRNEMFRERSGEDTMYLVKHLPKGDSEYVRVRNHNINYQNFTKYRVLEFWVFDPVKRESEIQILGVSLLSDVFRENENGERDYIGSMAAFWLKWEDVRQLLNQFMDTHPGNNLLRFLWDSHFIHPGLYIDSQNCLQSSAEKICTRHAIRNIETMDTVDGESNNDLHTANENRTIAQSFYDSIKINRLTAYRDPEIHFKDILPFDSIDLKIVPDTAVYARDAIGAVKKIDGISISTRDLDWNWFNNYNLLEEWSFDPKNGKTIITVLGIEPRFDMQDIDTTGMKPVLHDRSYWTVGPNPIMKPVLYKHMFWVRYKDVIGILDHYDEYHPLNNLSTSIWRSYFKE